MISFISSFEVINVVAREVKSEGRPGPKKILWIAASIADVAAVNPNQIKTLLANGLSTFFVKGNPVFSNVPKILPENPPDCPISCNWVFDNFRLVDELFAKV